MRMSEKCCNNNNNNNNNNSNNPLTSHRTDGGKNNASQSLQFITKDRVAIYEPEVIYVGAWNQTV